MSDLKEQLDKIEEVVPQDKRSDWKKKMGLGAFLLTLNTLEEKVETYKQWKLFKGHLHISFRHRSKKNLWGRFGGGWNWFLGIAIGGHTVMLNLLVCTIMITYYKEAKL